jgi:hypothetical protein
VITGRELRKIREASGLSQQQASEFFGCGFVGYGKMERTGVVPEWMKELINYIKPGNDFFNKWVRRQIKSEREAIYRRQQEFNDREARFERETKQNIEACGAGA